MTRAGWNSTNCWSHFFRSEHEQTGTAVAVEFRNRLVKLEQQVMSQYTAMAAYATIAKTDSESVKVEARADLDRSQSTVIGLVEKLRTEVNIRLDGLERRSANGDMSVPTACHVCRRSRTIWPRPRQRCNNCCRRTQELRTQIAGLVEHKMQEQGWLVSSGSAEALYLR